MKRIRFLFQDKSVLGGSVIDAVVGCLYPHKRRSVSRCSESMCMR